jgi:GT2 family glycosyltransferase
MNTRNLDIDLGGPLPRWLEVPEGAVPAAIVWLHGRPLGQVPISRQGGTIYRRGLARAVLHRFAEPILRELILNGLASPGGPSLELDRLLTLPTVESRVSPGRLTVVLCTDGSRPGRLANALDALDASTVPPAEIIVVHYGRKHGPVPERKRPVRWIVEPGADLARARAVAIEATRSPLVAFVDESVRVDPHWVAAVCRAFAEHPQAMAVTGSILPATIENAPSRLLATIRERLEWGDPYRFLRAQPPPGGPPPRSWLNVLQFGSEANLAVRTAALRRIGGFRAIAGDIGQGPDLLLRMLEAGFGIVRDPAASVRDGGVGSIDEAAKRFRAEAEGLAVALVVLARRCPARAVDVGLVLQRLLRDSLADLLRRSGEARSLAWARWQGHLRGCGRGLEAALGQTAAPPASATRLPSRFERGRVVPVELGEESAAEADRVLAEARRTDTAELLALWHGEVLGPASVVTGSRRLTRGQVARIVVERHLPGLLRRRLGLMAPVHEIDGMKPEERTQRMLESARRKLTTHLVPNPGSIARRAAGRAVPGVAVSVLVPTCDRPDDLRDCLRAILAQRTDRPVEVIVVDNRPESGRTAPVVAEFPGVRLLSETRQGSSYTRNRGLPACRGSIVVLCDDDVVVPPGWLEALLVPFDDPAVGVVTGNILPYRLEHRIERLNEAACSLGRGVEPFAVDGEWFRGSRESIHGWEFGTTANAAVRIELFRNPAVGLFAEALGPGTPVGAGEDPYFFYRVLKAGYRLEYLPDAWVWHKHRSSMRSLRRQVYNYAKSAVGYHLTTLLDDGDRRARGPLFGGLQKYYLRRLLAAACGRGELPARLVLVEIAGNLAGGFSFCVSHARRRRLARDPAHPPTPPALPDRVDAAADSHAPWALNPSTRAETAGPRGRRGRLPDFLIIGAQKAGTTALHHNLGKHPSIELVPNFRGRFQDWDNTKETAFFSGGGGGYGLATLDDYRALFNDNGRVQGEACPGYEDEKALAAIAEAIPEARLILICREPVARLESAYNHMMQWHGTNPRLRNFGWWDPARSFDENLRRELADPRRLGLLRTGIYADSIARVLERFRREQLLVLVAEEYRRDPQGTYDRICDFLGVPSVRLGHEDAHVRSYTAGLTREQREQLAEFYRPHNERFFRAIGREIPSWFRAMRADAGNEPYAA